MHMQTSNFLVGTAFQHPAVRKCFAGVPAVAVKVLKPHHITLILTSLCAMFPYSILVVFPVVFVFSILSFLSNLPIFILPYSSFGHVAVSFIPAHHTLFLTHDVG